MDNFRRAFLVSTMAAGLAWTTPAAAAPFTLTENFNSGVLDSHLIASNTPGYALNLIGGEAVMSGIGQGGGAYITANFDLIGDFSISVRASRATGIGYYGAAGPSFEWVSLPGRSSCVAAAPASVEGEAPDG